MAIHTFILECALKKLQVPQSALIQFRLAQALSDVDHKGFPQELFQLSAPMVIRGLLNYDARLRGDAGVDG
jgi:hypothetical protein